MGTITLNSKQQRRVEVLTRLEAGSLDVGTAAEMLGVGGRQGRVAVARALVNGAPLVLADEPTGNLDSQTGIQVLDMLRALNEEGQTIIMVTHDPEAAGYARRVISLLDGRLIGDTQYDIQTSDAIATTSPRPLARPAAVPAAGHLSWPAASWAVPLRTPPERSARTPRPAPHHHGAGSWDG